MWFRSVKTRTGLGRRCVRTTPVSPDDDSGSAAPLVVRPSVRPFVHKPTRDNTLIECVRYDGGRGRGSTRLQQYYGTAIGRRCSRRVVGKRIWTLFKTHYLNRFIILNSRGVRRSSRSYFSGTSDSPLTLW